MPRFLLKRPWSPEDDALLTQMHERGASITAMMARLRRTSSSVRARIVGLSRLARRARAPLHKAELGSGPP